MPVVCPATGEALGHVSVASEADVDRAVRAAQDGFARWRDTPAQELAACIRRAITVMREHAEELAWIDAVDTGNPFNGPYDADDSCLLPPD